MLKMFKTVFFSEIYLVKIKTVELFVNELFQAICFCEPFISL